MVHIFFRGLEKKQAVLLTHGDSVDKVAENFKSISYSSSNITGIANEKAHLYGLQFHPEVRNILVIIWRDGEINRYTFIHCSETDNILLLMLQVDLTTNGKLIMKNYLYGICGFSGEFTIKDRETKCIDHNKERVGDHKVLVIIFSYKLKLQLELK